MSAEKTNTEELFKAVDKLTNLGYKCDKDRAREISDYLQKTLDAAYDKLKQQSATN